MAQVNYCYRCGQRLGAGQASCWYCGASTKREVRPPRRCPLCDEVIQAKAVKCPHCSEYLDGRNTEKEKTVELDVRPGREPRAQAGPSGSPSAPPPKPGRSVDGPRRLALPSPGSPAGGDPNDRAVARSKGANPRPPSMDDTVDVEAISIHESSAHVIDDDNPLPIVGETPLPSPRGKGGPPDKVKKTPAKRPPSVPGARDSGAGLPARRGLFFGRKKNAPDYQDVETANPEDRYRICTICATEILVTDAYCYHCRARYGEEFAFTESARIRSNIIPHALTLACIGAFMVAPAALDKVKPEWVHPVVVGSALGAPLLSVWAFLRKRGFVARLISLLFFLASIAALYVEFGSS